MPLARSGCTDHDGQTSPNVRFKTITTTHHGTLHNRLSTHKNTCCSQFDHPLCSAAVEQLHAEVIFELHWFAWVPMARPGCTHRFPILPQSKNNKLRIKSALNLKTKKNTDNKARDNQPPSTILRCQRHFKCEAAAATCQPHPSLACTN